MRMTRCDHCNIYLPSQYSIIAGYELCSACKIRAEEHANILNIFRARQEDEARVFLLEKLRNGSKSD